MFSYPEGVSVDSFGNVFVGDTRNHRIRKITPSGAVTTLTGAGELNWPVGVFVDAFGNVYVSDHSNNRIRKVSASGIVSTVIGGTGGFNDGTGTSVRFSGPTGITADSIGNMYVADFYNHRIRKITVDIGPLPVCDSTWHHVALTYSGSSSTNTLTAYVDGLVVSSRSASYSISSLFSSTSTLRLGWNGLSPLSASESFSGSMSDVRIYNRSLIRHLSPKTQAHLRVMSRSVRMHHTLPKRKL